MRVGESIKRFGLEESWVIHWGRAPPFKKTDTVRVSNGSGSPEVGIVKNFISPALTLSYDGNSVTKNGALFEDKVKSNVEETDCADAEKIELLSVIVTVRVVVPN